MDQNNNKNQSNNNNPDTGEKTFTQEQLNAIVGERLAKERAKSEAALAERERELNKRELRLTAKERIKEKGLPEELIDALDVTDEETLNRALNAISKAINNKEVKHIIPNTLPDGDHTDDSPERELRKAMGLPV